MADDKVVEIEKEYACKTVPGSKVTAYCVSKGEKGCIYKRIGNCAGYKEIKKK